MSYAPLPPDIDAAIRDAWRDSQHWATRSNDVDGFIDLVRRALERSRRLRGGSDGNAPGA